MGHVDATCDECEDEMDPSVHSWIVEYDNGFAERLDLCDFCAGEIAGVRQDSESQ